MVLNQHLWPVVSKHPRTLPQLTTETPPSMFKPPSWASPGGKHRSASAGFGGSPPGSPSGSTNLSRQSTGQRQRLSPAGRSQSESRLLTPELPETTKANWRAASHSRTKPESEHFRALACSWPGTFNRNCLLMVVAGPEQTLQPCAVRILCNLAAWKHEIRDRRAYVVAFDAERLKAVVSRGGSSDVRTASSRFLGKSCICSSMVPLGHTFDEVSLSMQGLHAAGGLVALIRVVITDNPEDPGDWSVIGDPVTVRLSTLARPPPLKDGGCQAMPCVEDAECMAVASMQDGPCQAVVDMAVKYCQTEPLGVDKEIETTPHVTDTIDQLFDHGNWCDHLVENLPEEGVLQLMQALREAGDERKIIDKYETGHALDLMCKHQHLMKELSDAQLLAAGQALRNAASTRGLLDKKLVHDAVALLTENPKLLQGIMDTDLAAAIKTLKTVARSRLMEDEHESLAQDLTKSLDDEKKRAEDALEAAKSHASQTLVEEKVRAAQELEAERAASQAARERAAEELAAATAAAASELEAEIARALQELESATQAARERAAEELAAATAAAASELEAEKARAREELEAEKHRAAEQLATEQGERAKASEELEAERRHATEQLESERARLAEVARLALDAEKNRASEELAAEKKSALDAAMSSAAERARVAAEVEVEKQRLIDEVEAEKVKGVENLAAERRLRAQENELSKMALEREEAERERQASEAADLAEKEASKRQASKERLRKEREDEESKRQAEEEARLAAEEEDRMEAALAAAVRADELARRRALQRTRLRVQIVSAAGLRGADSRLQGGKSDPYCVCTVADRAHCKFQTDVIKKCLDPEWNQEHIFDAIAVDDALEFEVWDWDGEGKKGDFLGKQRLEPLVYRPDGFDGTLDLEDCGKGKHATLTLRVDILALLGDYSGSRLFVRVVSAEGLRAADKGVLLNRKGSSDPYVICNIPGKPLSNFETKVIKKSLSPVWNEESEISDYVQGDSIEFRVLDSDGKGSAKDDSLGTFLLDAAEFTPQGFKGTVTLVDAGKGVNATLTVHVDVC